MNCLHCLVNKASLGKRGLCFRCYGMLDVRAKYPNRVHKHFVQLKPGDPALARALLTVRREMSAALKWGPLTELQLARRLCYPIETIKEALADCAWFAHEADLVCLVPEPKEGVA